MKVSVNNFIIVMIVTSHDYLFKDFSKLPETSKLGEFVDFLMLFTKPFVSIVIVQCCNLPNFFYLLFNCLVYWYYKIIAIVS